MLNEDNEEQIIIELDDEYMIFTSWHQEVEAYFSKALATPAPCAIAVGNDASDEDTLRTSTNNASETLVITQQLDERFSFLSFVCENSKGGLSFDHIRRLWELFVVIWGGTIASRGRE